MKAKTHAPCPNGGLLAFTLVELLVVMVVIVTLMAVAVPAFIGIGRGAGMRTAVNNVRSTLSLARQWAITHRENVYFRLRTNEWVFIPTNRPQDQWVTKDNGISCYFVSNADNVLIQNVILLSPDVKFGQDDQVFVFTPEGGLSSGVGVQTIVLENKRGQAGAMRRTIMINGLTGGIRVE